MIAAEKLADLRQRAEWVAQHAEARELARVLVPVDDVLELVAAAEALALAESIEAAGRKLAALEQCMACTRPEARVRDVTPEDDIALCLRHFNRWLLRHTRPGARPPCKAHVIEGSS